MIMRQWLKDLAVRAAHEMGGELKQMGAHGAHELSAGLFSGSGFVMYPRGHHDQPDIHHGQPEQAHVEHEREI
jgi:hypothetical protein